MAYQINSSYLSSNRGVLKIIQVIIGFVTCSLLCANWYHGASCLYDRRLAFASALSFFILIPNVIIFLINILNMGLPRIECIYSAICLILFFVAGSLVVWFLIQYDTHWVFLITASILLFLESLLFLLDIEIIRGEISNE